MKEPTKEQQRWFWEQCGLEVVQEAQTLPSGIQVPMTWRDPDGNIIFTPDIDPNNLFKYAVPELQDKGYMVELYSYEQAGYKAAVYHITGQVDIPEVIVKDTDSALALFWASYSALGGKE